VKSACIFCGSSPGARPQYTEATEDLGGLLVEHGITLVYGGASVGLMGRLADTVLSEGGEAIGVMPRALVEREIAHLGLTDLHVVDSMHERKALMAAMSDAFIAMPGGFGTYEEFFEAVTWTQLGVHKKPCGLLNVAGFFDPVIEFLDRAVREEFIRPQHRAAIVVDPDPAVLLDALEHLALPDVPKWIGLAEA
jgi:uncharacterized protein (TIGR00730 family)